MINNPEFTDDEDNNDQMSLPTSGSEGMSISPKSTYEADKSKDIRVSLIVSDIQEISDEINALDFNDYRISCSVREKIIIALDRSRDEEITPFQDNADNNYSPLSLLKKGVEMFVHLKSSLNRQHEFALILLDENKCTWCLDFTSNVREVIKTLNTVTECCAEDIFDLNSLFNEIAKRVKIPNFNKDIPPPYVVRTVLLYNRSYTCPKIDITEIVKEILDLPYFTLDILASHEPVDETNNCKKIFSTLQNIDKKGFSYFFSVGRDINILLSSMGKLLGHPLQRPLRKYANYSIAN
ncbi:hypothetical protein HHI36_012519 [Cryptolaemus montrouzieri]|uniref:BRISC and BRCA1-A complex member 1 n=1 Tax=Cryptolaemus montrouzieri TaxID=559131 RepID=A0ABD2NFN7_9CUCU